MSIATQIRIVLDFQSKFVKKSQVIQSMKKTLDTLNLLIPGWGLILKGYPSLAVIFLIIWHSFLFIFCWAREFTTPTGLIVMTFFILSTHIGASISSSRLPTKHSQHSVFGSAVFVGVWFVLLLVFIYKRAAWFGWDIYYIPSESMSPTLLVGDILITDTWIYQDHQPQRRDIVIFRYPLNDSLDLIKRVAALPGEHIRIDGKHPYILQPDETTPSAYHAFVHTVKENHWYMLGDNIGDSYDSRFFGGVASDKLIGQARWIVFSTSESGSIRWQRIGQRL